MLSILKVQNKTKFIYYSPVEMKLAVSKIDPHEPLNFPQKGITISWQEYLISIQAIVKDTIAEITPHSTLLDTELLDILYRINEEFFYFHFAIKSNFKIQKHGPRDHNPWDRAHGYFFKIHQEIIKLHKYELKKGVLYEGAKEMTSVYQY
ncbi:MAG: hypothetical protein H7281_13075 [Bacteriovorax sp.]|nr:hypothetical protein [Bacteriovorax sp.]